MEGISNGVVRECKSNSGDTLCGVSQGSILGSTLFLIYVLDIPANITTHLVAQYADDTSCLIEDRCVAVLQVRESILEWRNVAAEIS